jgi:hypothetical protein
MERPAALLDYLAETAGSTRVEAGFKDSKRGGWGWHPSKMQVVSRVERLWLAMVVALGWSVSLGSQADRRRPVPCPERFPPTHLARKGGKRFPEQRCCPPQKANSLTLNLF